MSASIDRLFSRRTTTMSIWRSPAVTGGGQFGAPTQVAANVAFKRWPASSITMPAIAQALGELDSARVNMIGAVRAATDVRHGDELRDGAGNRYQVVRTGPWNATTIVALAQITPRPA